MPLALSPHTAGITNCLAGKMDSRSTISDSTRQQVIFEDYLYYAALQRREEEDMMYRATFAQGTLASETTLVQNEKNAWFSGISEAKSKAEQWPQLSNIPPMTEDEIKRANASRAMRVTSWVPVFYLLAADLLSRA